MGKRSETRTSATTWRYELKASSPLAYWLPCTSYGSLFRATCPLCCLLLVCCWEAWAGSWWCKALRSTWQWEQSTWSSAFSTGFPLTWWRKISQYNSFSFVGLPDRVMIITDAINIYGNKIPSYLPLSLMFFFVLTVSLLIVKLPIWFIFHNIYSLLYAGGLLWYCIYSDYCENYCAIFGGVLFYYILCILVIFLYCFEMVCYYCQKYFFFLH